MPCPNIFEKYELIHGACWCINNDMRGKNVLIVIISNKSLYIKKSFSFLLILNLHLYVVGSTTFRRCI